VTYADHRAWKGRLTPREAEVLELVAKGMTNKEIAREFVVEIATIKFHMSSVYSKLGLRNRVEATRWWIENCERALL
jgi:DNA-binding NarL/FixJ family response regulator